MVRMVRKQVYLHLRQSAMLKRQAKQLRTTEAELIRDAIDRQIVPHVRPDPEYWLKERAFIQGLIDMGPVAGKRTWTREELYDRC